MSIWVQKFDKRSYKCSALMSACNFPITAVLVWIQPQCRFLESCQSVYHTLSHRTSTSVLLTFHHRGLDFSIGERVKPRNYMEFSTLWFRYLTFPHRAIVPCTFHRRDIIVSSRVYICVCRDGSNGTSYLSIWKAM